MNAKGALGLVGVEGEAVQETLLKVQSAMAVSQGVQGLMEAKDSFKQLGTVAATVSTCPVDPMGNLVFVLAVADR